MHGTRVRSSAMAVAPPVASLSPRQKRSTTTTTTTTTTTGTAAPLHVSPSRRSPAGGAGATATTHAPPAASLSLAAPSRSVSQGAPPASPARGPSSASPSAYRGGHRSTVGGATTATAPMRLARTAGSIAPSVDETGTMLSAVSASKDTGVSLSSFAHDGERFEPSTYETTFRFRGDYQHVALAEATATLWCANARTGAMDLYSCVTGQFIASLQTLSEEVSARQMELAELPVNTTVKPTAVGAATGKNSASAVTPRTRGGVSLVVGGSGGAAASSATRHRPSAWVRVPEKDVKPTALRATATHVWAGYSDGTVAVYDALLLRLVTMGQFHAARVTVLTVLASGQVVSGSADGLLVLWDTESAGFEAVTRVTVLLDAVRAGAGALCAMAAVPAHATRVVCGFESGEVFSVFVASRPQEQTPAHLLKAHSARVNDMAVVRDLLFTAAEDHSVCVWYCGNAPPTASAGHGAPVGASQGLSSPAALPDPPTTRALQNATKLLKRVPVKPCVRGLLAEAQTRSVWVAYADGLLERWSANPDDDFGVEETVHNALVEKATEDRTAATAAATANGESAAYNRTSSGSNGASVKALLSLSAVQTMQWLALSSNGVNKVWYGHKNTLEMRLANSLLALHDVVAQDAEDAAAWREKVNVLKQKELERKESYICILEQLNEQRVLQRYYARWKQSVLFCGVQKKRTTAVAETLEKRAQVQLVRRFFGTWASFYNAQQRHMRGYVLSMALSRATERQQLHASFVAWQSFLVKQRLRQTAQVSAEVMANMVEKAHLSTFFHQWRAAVLRNEQRKKGISQEHLALLAHKAQRQVQQRVLRQWMAHSKAELQKRCVAEAAAAAASAEHEAAGQSTTESLASPATAVAGASALARFAAHYAQLQQQRQARQVLHTWRRWTVKKTQYASLAAVAALRTQQLLYETRLAFFLRWRQCVHARHTRENAAQLTALEATLRRAEAEHGDIFEKLQLQKQLDQLTSRQAAEEAQLAHTKSQLAALEQSCTRLRVQQEERQRHPTNVSDTPLTVRQQQQQHVTVHGGSDVGSAAASHEDPAASVSDAASVRRSSVYGGLPGMDVGVHHTGTSASYAGGGGPLSGGGRGHMSTNAVFYRSLVDQQRLSPIVLAHMPMEEAVHHVMGQLKGNVVNLYTDLALFRQVKDRRRAGTSAVGILLEAFGELKRMIVSTVRGASATAASAAARSGVKATRWPLSMEALDCIPVHQCSNVLSAIKTIVVAYDLLLPEDVPGVQSTCEEVVANADWVFLIARACYLRRKPLPPANMRQVV